MSYPIHRNWTWGIIIFLSVWIILIVAAPVLHAAQHPLLKSISYYLYLFFRLTCHQLSSRSLHLGDYALAVCTRCFAFYAGGLVISICCLLFTRIKMLRLRTYFFLTCPLLIDFILGKLNLYHDIIFIRFLTGFLTGMALFHFLLAGLSQKK